MPDTVDLSNLGLFRRHPIWQVHFKTEWATAWQPLYTPLPNPATTVQPHLFVNWLQLGMMPQGSTAELSFRLARGRRQDIDPNRAQSFRDASFEEVTMDTAALGGYVKIECFPDQSALRANSAILSFVGIITDSSSELEGADTELTYEVRGMEWLLMRTRLCSSFVQFDTSEVEIGRALAFNSRGSCRDHHMGIIPNCTVLPGSNGAHIFAERNDLSMSQRWSAWHILHYLIKYHAPKSVQGREWAAGAVENIPWSVPAAGSDVAGLEWYEPYQVECDGRTIADVISQVVDPRRLATWWVDVDTSVEPNVCRLKVAALNEANITLPEASIPANARQVAVVQYEDPGVQHAVLSESLANQYDRVVARGARIGACFTASIADDTLEKDWSDAEEAEYIAGASGAGGYGALDYFEQIARNDTVRKSDKVKRVFSYFRLALDFDGKAGDGEGGTKHVAFSPPLVLGNPDGTPGTPDTFHYLGLRFENFLPLYESADYSGTKIEDQRLAQIQAGNDGLNFDSTVPEGSSAPLLRPIVAIKLGPSGSDRWEQVEKLASDNEAHASAGQGRHHSCSTSSQDDTPGLIVNVNGSLPHALASVEFDPATDPPSNHQPDLDWNYLLATVFVQTDSHAIASWPLYPTSTGRDCERLLILDLPQYRADYVCKNTVVKVADGALVRSTSGGLVRDDRSKLVEIAQMAWRWYSVWRRAIRLAYRGLDPTLALGKLITTLDGSSVNSTITMMRYDCVRNVTSFHTQFGELDFEEAAARPGRGPR